MPVPWGGLAGRREKMVYFYKRRKMQGGGDTVCEPDGLPAAALRLCRSAKWLQPLDRHLGAGHAKGMPVRSARKRKFEMDAREELCQKLMDIVDIGYDLMAEYDPLPHQYGEVTMYQAEIESNSVYWAA